MIELKHDSLKFSFSEVHPEAQLTIDFQRTLRIPDDGKDYPLPPGLGQFPMKHVDDYSEKVPAPWIQHGGVMLPMYQSEALWLNFNPEFLWDHDTSYPFAIKVATGKINAVTGDDWIDGLKRRRQDYMVSTEQPWLDGYCVEKGFIRQFVAMPLGSGYSAEEQITGEAEHGGIQIVVYPMKREIFEKRFPKIIRSMKQREFMDEPVCYSLAEPCADMGLAPGGRMRQEIYEDPFKPGDWDMDKKNRCFIHLTNSMVWRAITGGAPPTVPFTAEEYTRHGLPWFDYYSDKSTALKGSEKLKGLKSVVEMGKEKGENPVPENESVDPGKIVKLRKGLKKGQVREGTWGVKGKKKMIKTKDEFINEVIRIAEDRGFRIENSRRNGLKQIDFGHKKLHAGHLEQLYPNILSSTEKISDQINEVAPGRSCTHKPMREILGEIRQGIK